MAGIPIKMSQLKQILLLFMQGYCIKGIARETGVSRNNINGYLRAIQFRNINAEEVLHMENPQAEHLLCAPVRSEKQRKDDLLQRLENLRIELQHQRVTRQLLWEP